MKKNRKKLIVIGFLLFIILFVWPQFIPPIRPSNLSWVTIKLRRTACFGTCPVYSLTVHGDGTVEYDGSRSVWIQGKHSAKISEDKVRELVDEFYKAGYWWNSPFYSELKTDASTIISSITIGFQTKSVTRIIAGPERLINLENKIDEIAGTDRWTKGIDTSLPPFPPPVDYDNAVITYEQTGDMARSKPVYKLTILGDGSVTYEGIDNVKIAGLQTSRISKKDFKNLINMFNYVNFLAIKEEQSLGETEDAAYITSLSIDGFQNTVVDTCWCLSDMRMLYQMIQWVVNSDQWVR